MAKPLIATRVDKDLYTKLKAIERDFDIPVSDVIRRALRVYLKDYRGGKILEPLNPNPN